MGHLVDLRIALVILVSHSARLALTPIVDDDWLAVYVTYRMGGPIFSCNSEMNCDGPLNFRR